MIVSGLLLLIAVVLCTLLAPFAIVWGVVDGLRFGGLRRRARETMFEAAYALDVFGNTAYASLLNGLFCKRGAHWHGLRGETVSSVLGKNWTMGTATRAALCLIGTLNLIDRDHCYKYIMGPWELPKPPDVPLWMSLLIPGVMAVGVVVVYFC